MIGFAFAATVLNYVHRLSFTYLAAHPDLRPLFSDTTFGLMGTAFFVAYTISNGLCGFAIDRLGTRIGYSLSMAVWTTAALLHAVARTPLQFGALRFLLGIGEAGNWPAAVKLTAEWFPPRERSTASGIFNSGSALGSVIAPPLVAWLGMRFGWQVAFLVVGAMGYFWLAAFWLVYRTPSTPQQQVELSPVPVRRLLTHRFVVWFTASKFFMDSIWYFITFWIGRYLADAYGWDLWRIGLFAMFPFIVADLGNILGGFFTQWLIRGGRAISNARKLAVSVFALTMAAALLSGPLVISGPPRRWPCSRWRASAGPPTRQIPSPSPRMSSRSARWPRCGAWQAALVSAAHSSSTRPVSLSPTCARLSALPARTTPCSSPMVCWPLWG